MEAISHAGTVLGVLAKDGVVLAAEKKVTGKLLDLSGAKEGGYGGSGEKIFLLNSCAPSPCRLPPKNSFLTNFFFLGCQERHWGCRGHHGGCQLAGQLCADGSAATFVELQRGYPC